MHGHPSLRRALAAVYTLLALTYLPWAAWGPVGINARAVGQGLALLLTAGVAVTLALPVLVVPRRARPRLRAAWLLFLTALVLFGLEGLRELLQAAGRSLDINLSDPLRLLALLCAGAGLILYPRPPHPGLGRLPLWADCAISTFALLAGAWLLALRPLANSYAGYWPILLYPLFGLALLAVGINVFLLSDPRYLPAPHGWIGLAMLTLAANGFGHALVLQMGSPTAGRLDGAGWVVGCYALGMAALTQPVFSPGLVGPGPRLDATRARLLARLQVLVPLILTILLGWYALFDWVLGARDLSGMLATVVLGLAIIARQSIVAGEIEFQQYANLVTSIAEPTFVCDERGLLRLVNPALLAATGYPTARSLLGQPLALIIEPEEDAARMLNLALALQARGGDTRPLGWTGETALCRRDGTSLPVYLSLRPIQPVLNMPNPTAERLALAGTAHDLTWSRQQQADLKAAYEQVAAARADLETLNAALEEKVAQETANLQAAYRQLEEQNRKLQLLDRLKSDFVSLVSHELRGPLTNISGGIELVLSRREPLPESARSHLTLVQAEIQRLARFVKTILDLSALDAGRLPLYPAPVDLTEITASLRAQFAHRPGGERIRWQVPPGLPAVQADEQALNSVLVHLLDNALKYAPEGEITVSAAADDGRVAVQVRDQGPGIAPEALPLLFDRFYRSNSEDSQTVYGHGLGLYIARRLAQAMGGQIEAGNLAEGGACFTFWLRQAENVDREEMNNEPQNPADR